MSRRFEREVSDYFLDMDCFISKEWKEWKE